MFHITCLAYLIHNFAFRIRSFFKDIESLIGAIKMCTIKNNSNRFLFVNEGIPSHQIVITTRWSSWLRVAMYYSEYLPRINEIINTIENDGIFIRNAKDELSNLNVFHSLFQIKTSYRSLIHVIDGFKNSAYNIKTRYNQLINLNLNDDPCAIKDYILKQLQKQDIMSIINFGNRNISLSIYACLHKCPVTSIAVKRSFSVLNKMLCEDRQFAK